MRHSTLMAKGASSMHSRLCNQYTNMYTNIHTVSDLTEALAPRTPLAPRPAPGAVGQSSCHALLALCLCRAGSSALGTSRTRVVLEGWLIHPMRKVLSAAWTWDQGPSSSLL